MFSWGVKSKQAEGGAVRRSACRVTRGMIIEEIYDALIEAGASESKARAAARAMTNYETRISKIESDINLLKWMAGFNLAITVAILFRVFS